MTTHSVSARAAAAARRPRRRMPMSRRRALLGWAYAAPAAAFVVLLFLLPLLTVSRMSVSDWSLLGGDKGLNAPDNFVDVFREPLLWPSVAFTLEYTVIVGVIVLVLAMLLALLVQESTRWNSVLRTAVLVPSALGLASSSLLFWGLYSPNIGPLNPILQGLGIIDEPISFLGTPDAALWSTVFLIVWRFTGFYMLILMVGLQAIPGDVYEAARLDGAGRIRTYWSVTLPLLRPSIALATVLSVTGSLLAFDQFFILTKGGPDNTTVTIVQLIYRAAFQHFDLGVAGAMSLLVLAALLVINLIQFRLLRAKD
ncbi:sugar ABC transporter permease [Galbitalea sp. SE-J8]|uniref:carbohydrate ABC transporter permease n=1 Tax=Galbitalea sp. SE-J8 TaxID=3054952 RepID=UPI00259C6AAC|nr:sugar ABC transporter permease [Galbitalea sp. SE-J8]MDM4762002.1 sugar ABC transporter permease [Galbitalea sp. SE-J8]